jgi:hypothetical protein
MKKNTERLRIRLLDMGEKPLEQMAGSTIIDDLVKSLFGRLPGESRGPERLEITGFRLSPE